MTRTPTAPADSALRAIPAVERVLSGAALAPLIASYGRVRVKEALTAHLHTLREERGSWDEPAAVAAITAAVAQATGSSLRRVINGSGVIIHTNLGRSPIGPAVWQRTADVVTGYSNLEFDLDEGERGARDEHLAALCGTLFGCEAAILTNNNAAGTLLALAAVASGREVVVSRGELVEIGGAFRVPDVIQQGGAKLREVGTTNRTRASDYAVAVTRRTAALLRVHRSNFDIVGFTETPSIAELVAVARAKKLPLLYDEGSGHVVDLESYGFTRDATLRELIAAGVDLVMCSTDKLIGATQGGLILGRADLIARCRKHPLLRALRAGKESYAVVAETLRAFATGAHEREIPIYEMLAARPDALRARAEELTRGMGGRVVASSCALGGGTTPTETIPSIAVEVPGHAAALQERLLRNDPPIVGRIVDDRFLLDMRTLLAGDVGIVAQTLRDLASYQGS
jgi:L-seryl-tRNA(Ser) seleniumtransferase